MIPRICISAFLLTVCLSLLVACGEPASNGGAAWGAFCNRTSDCAPGLLCKGNVCCKEMPDGDIDNPFDRAVDDNDPDSIDDIITDGDNDNDDEEYAEYASESESEYDIDWDGVDPDSGPFWPVDTRFIVTTVPRYADRPVTLNYFPLLSDFPVRSELFEQHKHFHYGPLETTDGRYVFSSEGFKDLTFSRFQLALQDRAYLHQTLHVILFSPGITAYDPPKSTQNWNDWEIRTIEHDAETPSLPGFALYHDGEEAFNATGEILDATTPKKIYYARYHEDGSNPDFVSLNQELVVDVLAPKALCLPLYYRTDITNGGIVLMTGCDADDPEEPGMFSRFDYHTETFDELGLVKRDAHRYITDTTRYSVVQGPEDFFIFDGYHAWRDSRWLANFSGAAYDGSIILSSGYGQCTSDNFSDRMLRSCPLGDTGTCHTHGPVLQYSYEENPSIMMMASTHDGAFHGYYTHRRSQDMPDEWCNAEREYDRVLVHMDAQGRFTGQIYPDSAFLPYLVSPDGTKLVELSERSTLRLYRLPDMELLWELPGHVSPDTDFPDGLENGPWQQTIVFANERTLLYLSDTLLCFSGSCGNLMAFDMESGEKWIVEYRVRAFRLLDDGSLLIARTCDLEVCENDAWESAILEHIPDIHTPGIRSSSYLTLEGTCGYNGADITACWMYKDPEVNWKHEQVLMQIDYRPNHQVLTEIYHQSDYYYEAPIHRPDNSDHIYFRTSYTRRMAYNINEPSTLMNYGCGQWSRMQIREFPDYVISGRSIIPRATPQSYYELPVSITAVDPDNQYIYFNGCNLYSNTCDPSQSFRLDIPQMAETLEPLPSCD